MNNAFKKIFYCHLDVFSRFMEGTERMKNHKNKFFLTAFDISLVKCRPIKHDATKFGVNR